MTTLRSFADIQPDFNMLVRQTTQSLLRWALSDEYRAVRSRSGHVMHRRFEGHTLQELDDIISRIALRNLRLADAVRNTPEYKACVQYLCTDEHRPGQLVSEAA